MDAVVAARGAVGKDFQLGFIGRGRQAVLGAGPGVSGLQTWVRKGSARLRMELET